MRLSPFDPQAAPAAVSSLIQSPGETPRQTTCKQLDSDSIRMRFSHEHAYIVDFIQFDSEPTIALVKRFQLLVQRDGSIQFAS
jgi:hypothetical protein